MATPRSLRPEDAGKNIPIYCVWEITLRCDHACSHCGSRAGPSAREDELSTEEMLETADALVRLGTREVTLIGGEAYLRGDCYDLITHLAKQGVRVTMQTGGARTIKRLGCVSPTLWTMATSMARNCTPRIQADACLRWTNRKQERQTALGIQRALIGKNLYAHQAL